MEKRVEDEGVWDRLPLELQTQILYFLPVKTLLVLRAVAKWFLSTIDHPGFAVSHLRNFPANIDQNIPLIINAVPATRLRELTHYQRNSRMILRSSINGISLFFDDTFGTVAADAYLLNIATERRNVLPRVPKSKFGEFKHFFLGYDDTRRDYRVLAKTSTKAWLFKVRMRRWEEINATSSGFRGTDKRLQTVICSQSMCFENALVWTESFKDEPDWFGLVWFSLGEKTFRYSENIPCVGGRSNGVMWLDGGSSLGVWTVNDVVGSIWALRTDTMTWARRYEVPRELVPFGEGIMVANVSERGQKIESWCWDEKQKTIENVSYDIGTREISRPLKVTLKHSCSCGPFEGDGDPSQYVCYHGDYVCLGGSFVQSLIKL